MNTCHRVFSLSRILTATALAATAVVSGIIYNHPMAGRSTAGTVAPPLSLERLSLVCLGYVDMEPGIASLYAPASGQVTQVMAIENAMVPLGTVLVQLDDRAAKLRVREAESDLKGAQRHYQETQKLPQQHKIRIQEQQAVVVTAQQRLIIARLALTRKIELVRMNQLNQTEVQAAEASVRELEAAESVEQSKLHELQLNDPMSEVERGSAQLEVKQAQLELALHAVGECQLRAPQDGTILRVLVSPGDVLGPSSKQAAVLFCPKGDRIIRAEVEQEFAGRVAEGQIAYMQDDTHGGQTWLGKVKHVSGWFTPRRSIVQEPLQFNDVRTLECIISLDPGQPALRIGQRLRVKINEKT